jgi:hypothetical protein
MKTLIPSRGPALAAIFFLALSAVLLPAAPAAHAAASLTLSRQMAAPQDAVTVTGHGFASNVMVATDAAFQIGSRSVTVQKSTFTDNTGTFHASFAVPAGAAPGYYTVRARDFRNQTAATTLHVLPLVVLHEGATSPPTFNVIAGRLFYVSGWGFQAAAGVKIAATFPLYNGNSVTVTKSPTTGPKGAFHDVLIQAPFDTRQGTVSMTGTDSINGKQAISNVNVVYRPAISLSSLVARPGGSVTVSGTGFVPNVTVHVTLPVQNGGTTTTIAKDVTTDEKGNFSTTIDLSSSLQQGSYSINATGTQIGLTAAAKLAISLKPTITIQPATVSPGQVVKITGGGYGAHVTVYIAATVPLYGGGNRTVATSVTTDAQGAFATSLQVPGHAAAGTVSIAAQGPHAAAHASLAIKQVLAVVTVSPNSVIPGSSVRVTGSGFLAGSKVDISLLVSMVDGSKKTLTASVTTSASGQFTTTFQIPGNVRGGNYTLSAKAQASGRVRSTTLAVARLAPSIVAAPPNAVPGTDVTVNGFGFAAGAAVTISLQGTKVGSATANGSGQFSTKITVPSNEASGSYTLSASSSSGRSASFSLAVNRQVSTHFYFASLYTGTSYHEYLAILNPTEIKAKVTISYQLTNGSTKSATAAVNPHTRYTEDVNADLGAKVSAAAAVAADVPVVVERFVTHGSDMAIVPGATAPATPWYFANGNTSGNYREFIAIQNPNTSQIQVAVRFLPTHHRQFTIYRTMPPTSRTTVKVSSYVRDAVGVIVTSGSPVVANRSMFIRHGTTSKIGVTAPQRSWYFAGGPRNAQAKNYIAAINPRGSWSRVTLHVYGPYGQELQTIRQWLKPYARVFYLMNRIVHRTDVAVAMTASSPIVAEQTTYAGRMHDASTDSFGAPAPARSWAFAAASTWYGRSSADILDLFNPSLTPVPIVVQFINASGTVTSRTYVVSPLSHEIVDVASVMPNAQLGLVATSDLPFVALNRMSINIGAGADTSRGTPIT